MFFFEKRIKKLSSFCSRVGQVQKGDVSLLLFLLKKKSLS